MYVKSGVHLQEVEVEAVAEAEAQVEAELGGKAG